MSSLSWQTFGHLQIKNILARQVEATKFSHAYLFVGPEGIGKKTLAFEFSEKILKTDNLNSHPDFSLLDTENDEITVGTVKNFLNTLYVKPFIGQYKVAIICNAERLNIQASNALLKTLEEPTESTILILESSESGLLSTIISRCQVFSFNKFTSAQLLKYAEINKKDITEHVVSLSFGSIARMLQLVNQNDFLKQSVQEVASFKTILNNPPGQRLSFISEYADLETQNLEQLFTNWLNWQAGNLLENSSNFLILDKLNQALLDLKSNKNKKLILQELFLKI